MALTTLDPEAELVEFCAEHFYDPYGWVMLAYPWGHGDLFGFDGPNYWQEKFLKDWGEAIQERDFDGLHAVAPWMAATTSGHGVGKSALVGMAVGFIMSTRP